MRTTKWFGLVAVVAIPALAGFAQTPEAATPGAPDKPEAAVPANLSPGAAEVVKLATSGVGDDVVLAYIKNSQALFNLSANDVLYLKDIGLSAEITSAMLSHDSTLRGQAQQYAPAAQRQFTKDLGFRGIGQADPLPRLQLGCGLAGSRGGEAERLVQRG